MSHRDRAIEVNESLIVVLQRHHVIVQAQDGAEAALHYDDLPDLIEALERVVQARSMAPCTQTNSHTRSSCGYPLCRES